MKCYTLKNRMDKSLMYFYRCIESIETTKDVRSQYLALYNAQQNPKITVVTLESYL